MVAVSKEKVPNSDAIWIIVDLLRAKGQIVFVGVEDDRSQFGKIPFDCIECEQKMTVFAARSTGRSDCLIDEIERKDRLQLPRYRGSLPSMMKSA